METFFKKPRIELPKYLEWLTEQQSCISPYPADDPHHIKCPGFGGTVKCSDIFAIPLARFEHRDFHNVGWVTWETKNRVDQRELALRTLEKAFRDGVFVLGDL